MKNRKKEKCIVCGKKLDIPIDLHIAYREDYVDGAGQLCNVCAFKLWTKKCEKKFNDNGV